MNNNINGNDVVVTPLDFTDGTRKEIDILEAYAGGTVTASVLNTPDIDCIESWPNSSGKFTNRAQYDASLLAAEQAAENRGKRGINHPAHNFLDQIETASSFNEPSSGQLIRTLVQKIRSVL